MFSGEAKDQFIAGEHVMEGCFGSTFTGTTGYYQAGQNFALGVAKGNRQASALNTSVMEVAELTMVERVTLWITLTLSRRS